MPGTPRGRGVCQELCECSHHRHKFVRGRNAALHTSAPSFPHITRSASTSIGKNVHERKLHNARRLCTRARRTGMQASEPAPLRCHIAIAQGPHAHSGANIGRHLQTTPRARSAKAHRMRHMHRATGRAVKQRGCRARRPRDAQQGKGGVAPACVRAGSIPAGAHRFCVRRSFRMLIVARTRRPSRTPGAEDREVEAQLGIAHDLPRRSTRAITAGACGKSQSGAEMGISGMLGYTGCQTSICEAGRSQA